MTPLQKEALTALLEGPIDRLMIEETYGEHVIESLALSGHVELVGTEVRITPRGVERVKQ